MDSKLVLHFVRLDDEVGLFSTEFFHIAVGELRRTVRGKTPGAFRSQGVFQWSSAVQALAVLFLKSKCACAPNMPDYSDDTIEGMKGSRALSLDYAITKGPIWVADMFGTDSFGRLIAPRLFRRTNSNLKFPGPVVIAVNDNVLRPCDVSITLDGVLVEERAQLVELLKRVMTQCGMRSSAPGEGVTELRQLKHSEEKKLMAVA